MPRRFYYSPPYYCILVALAVPLAMHSTAAAQTNTAPQSGEAKAVAPSSQADIRKLEVGKPIEREIKGGESHAYEIELEVGRYLNVVVDQRGIDVKVSLSGPEGKPIFEFNRESGKEGQETITVVAEASGAHRLDVQPVDQKAVAGRYVIRVAELRAATEQDRQLQEARKLYGESVRLWRRGQYDEALPLGERALAIREKGLGPDHPDVATSLNDLAILYAVKGDNAKSEPLFQRALAIRERTLGPDHPDVAASLNNLANLYRHKADYAKAEPLYRRALVILEKSRGPDHPLVATSLNNLANVCVEKGDYAKAEPLYLRALAIREKALGPDHTDVAASLNNLALLYADKRDYAKAEQLYQRALTIREKSLGLDHSLVANQFDNLALLYASKGDYAKAEPMYLRALAIRERALGPDHSDVATSLINLAFNYDNKGEYAKAEPLYQRALTIREKSLVPDHPQVADSLNGLASFYADRGGYAKAEPLYQRALAIYEKALGPDHPAVARSLNDLAVLYSAKGYYAKAKPLYLRALAIREKTLGADHPDVAGSLNSLATYYSDRGDYSEAVACLSRAVKISEHNIASNLNTGSERQKRLYLATLLGQTNDVISLHAQAAPANLPARRLAVTTVLQRKGRALDAMTDSIAALRRRANPEDRELIDQLTDARARLPRLVLGGPGDTKTADYRAEIKRLEDQVEELEATISRRSAVFRTQSQAVTLEAVQATIPPHSSLVEFISYHPRNPKAQKAEERYGESHYVAYVLAKKGEVKWVELGGARQIDDAINGLRAVLRRDDDKPLSSIERDVKPLARKVDELVMQPVRRLLGKKRQVMISPDGMLNLIPFAALVDEKGRYLVERYHFTYLTTGRDLLRLKEHLPSKQGMMIVANPDYGPMSESSGSRSLKIVKFKIIDKIQAPGASDGSVVDQMIDFSRIEFPPLVGTEQEARALKSLIPEATTAMHEQATKAAIEQANAPSILHIATHGFFLEDLESGSKTEERGLFIGNQPNASVMRIEDSLLRSGLAMAGANLHKSDDNGILTALEVSGLNLWGTKMVVLSACETGLGKVDTGNGIFGLRRALVLAGSESQMLSLWKVDDEATRDLMIDYYTGLKAGVGRSEALRQVQLKMVGIQRYQHPYYWASFIESGEWARLDGKR